MTLDGYELRFITWTDLGDLLELHVTDVERDTLGDKPELWITLSDTLQPQLNTD